MRHIIEIFQHCRRALSQICFKSAIFKARNGPECPYASRYQISLNILCSIKIFNTFYFPIFFWMSVTVNETRSTSSLVLRCCLFLKRWLTPRRQYIRHLGVKKFKHRYHPEGQSASSCKISSKSAKRWQGNRNFLFFMMAVAAILNCQKFKF